MLGCSTMWSRRWRIIYNSANAQNSFTGHKHIGRIDCCITQNYIFWKLPQIKPTWTIIYSNRSASSEYRSIPQSHLASEHQVGDARLHDFEMCTKFLLFTMLVLAHVRHWLVAICVTRTLDTHANWIFNASNSSHPLQLSSCWDEPLSTEDPNSLLLLLPSLHETWPCKTSNLFEYVRDEAAQASLECWDIWCGSSIIRPGKSGCEASNFEVKSLGQRYPRTEVSIQLSVQAWTVVSQFPKSSTHQMSSNDWLVDGHCYRATIRSRGWGHMSSSCVSADDRRLAASDSGSFLLG